MRDLFTKLFAQSHFDTGIRVTPFSPAHLVYLALVFGSFIFLYLRYRDRQMQEKEKLLRGLVYALMLSYFSDFFVQQFVYGGMTEEKLPFHICIVIAVMIPFAQFNRNGKKILEPVTVMAILSTLMYLMVPASVGEGEPWCYQTVQVMFFHGVELLWGLLNLMLGVVRLEKRNIWKSAVLLGAITLWAKFGNLLYQRNFFFLEEDAFHIGLVAQGVIPRWLLMIVNPLVYFSAVLFLYVVCCSIHSRKRQKQSV